MSVAPIVWKWNPHDRNIAKLLGWEIDGGIETNLSAGNHHSAWAQRFDHSARPGGCFVRYGLLQHHHLLVDSVRRVPRNGGPLAGLVLVTARREGRSSRRELRTGRN